MRHHSVVAVIVAHYGIYRKALQEAGNIYEPIIIVGGYDKHIPFDGLGDELNLYAKAVIATGDTGSKILEAVTSSEKYIPGKVKLISIDSFDEAVRTASELAEEGDIVLLSPACAAFDRFKNFAERGRHFKQLVREMQE